MLCLHEFWLFAADDLDAASTLFTTLAGKLSDPQAVNWLAGTLLSGGFDFADSTTSAEQPPRPLSATAPA